MPRLVVVIDARKARQGADEFVRQQERMRNSARQGAQDTAQANEATIDTILSGLDREIERRTAVQEALKRGTNEARIEQKIQDTINTARARGIALGDAEIQMIRDKARASQELANAQSEAFRMSANEERENTSAARARAAKAQLAEARGWIGDIGDAFSQVGQTIFGLTDAQTKAVETTIYMTEKGMALGEVFGPTGAIIGATAGFVVGLATSEIRAAKEAENLRKQVDEMHKSYQKQYALWQKSDALDLQYLGINKIRIALEDLSAINISEINAKISKLAAGSDKSAMNAQQYDNMIKIKQAVDDVIADKGGALTGAADALGEILELNKRVAAEETTNIANLQGRYAEAQANVEGAEQAVKEYQDKLREVSEEEAAAARAAYDAFNNSDRGVAASQKLEAALGKLSDKAREYIPRAVEVGARHKKAVDAAKEAQDKLNAAMDKSPWLMKAIGSAAKDMADDLTGGALDTFLRRVASGEISKKIKDNEAEKQKAIDAAKQRAAAIKDLLDAQARNAENAAKINAAFASGGADAAELEAAMLNKIGDKKLKPEQAAQLRADVAKEIELNKQLAASRKAIADADAQKKKTEDDAAKAVEARNALFEATSREIEQAEQLAFAMNLSSEEYAKQMFLLPRLQKIKDAGGSDAQIEQERQRAEALYAELEGIKKVQKAREDAAEKSKEAEEKALDEKKQAQEKWQSFAEGSLDSFASTLNDALWEGQQDWGAFFKSIGKDLTAMLIKMAIAAAIKAFLSGGTSLAGGASAGVGKALMGTFFHSGGTVGSGGVSRAVDASMFIGAPRYHNGTPYVGLKPDEVPAILQRGEEVRSRAQVAADRATRGATQIVIQLPGVQDSRGFMRSVHQNADILRRVLGE